MKNTDFLSMSSYVRVQEKRLLDKNSIDRVADAPSTQEALRMLSQNTDYDFTSLRRPEDYETVVKAELARVYRMAYDVAKNFPALPEILGCKYDFHNVKAALKAKYLGQPDSAPFVEITPVPAALIAKVVEKFDSKANLPAHIMQAIVAGSEAFDKSGNPQDIDITVDKLMYTHMMKLAQELGSDFIIGYVRAAVDFYNLKTLMRVKSMQKGTAFLAECMADGGNTDPSFFLQNYGKTAGALSMAFVFKSYGPQLKAGVEAYERGGNYSELERLLDNYLIDYVKSAKRVSFGPEILFAYLVSKENEVRQIRILAACKINQISSEVLKERLRDNYV